ncbi:hypothetical protein EJ08DRAFT_226949 [Tothia fuscella]|uniref:DUF6594 domain-containing protein n=1 Tax=Tothia fuscella TaxID=1048955 RepID=A0A9P4P3T4_9PEZI|nr:hypothetical protein EJ08DRAFT_226949 [Tothia fuscella]
MEHHIAQPGSIEDTLGSFFPRLSRILEDTETRHQQRRTRVTEIKPISSSPETNTRRDKPAPAASVDSKSDVDSDSDSSSDSDSDDEKDEVVDENDEEEEEDDTDDPTTRPSPTARSSSRTVTNTSQSTEPMALPDSDSLVQRLREQEEEVRQHVLHSPRPQRSLRTQVNSAFQPSSPLPLYDHRVPSAQHGYPYAPPPAPNVPHFDPAYAYTQSLHHPSLPPDAPFGLDLQKTTIAGYELLASKLAGSNVEGFEGVRAVYRKFEHLNHRVLLHLQDEISELEEELRILDESIAQMTPFTEDHTLQPASRRREARYGSELHFQRTQVLGRVFVKLGQYNQALSSFNNATESFASAKATDISAYRAFMEKNAPIEALESRFLAHEQDLMALSRVGWEESSSTPASSIVNPKQATLSLCILVLLPLLAFVVVKDFFARFIIVMVVAVSGMVVSSTDLGNELIPTQYFNFGASLYFAVMSITALIMS